MMGTAPDAAAYNRKTIKAKKITFNFSGSDAIALKDHTRPDHDEENKKYSFSSSIFARANKRFLK